MGKGNKRVTNKRKEYLHRMAEEYKFDADEFHPGQYRLTKDNCVTVDYYPKSNRCFFHDCQEWDTVENLAAFLKFQFTEYKKPYTKDKF